jgi:hypothetical protein
MIQYAVLLMSSPDFTEYWMRFSGHDDRMDADLMD